MKTKRFLIPLFVFLVTVPFTLAGCVGFVQLGKTKAAVGQTTLHYGPPDGGSVKPPQPVPTRVCDEFEAPIIDPIPLLLSFSEKQMDDSEYVAVVTAQYAVDLRIYSFLTAKQWADARIKQRNSCRTVLVVP